MKHFIWNNTKNEILKIERGVSFEKVINHIEQGDTLDIIEHPDQKRYPDQNIYVVKMDDYAYLVPFVEEDYIVFLKTIIPSRKATRKYLR